MREAFGADRIPLRTRRDQQSAISTAQKAEENARVLKGRLAAAQSKVSLQGGLFHCHRAYLETLSRFAAIRIESEERGHASFRS
jgi:hypothetical protein